MATGSINIGNKQTVLATSPNILAMDQYNTEAEWSTYLISLAFCLENLSIFLFLLDSQLTTK
jgi:hypothetical protein